MTKRYLIFQPETDEIDLERIGRFQKRIASRKASICPQRAVIYTKSFQQTEGEPYIVRKAKAFAATLAQMDIYAEQDSLIFGNQASKSFAAPVFPEYSIDWIIDELDGTHGSIAFEQRKGDVFACSQETKDALRSIAPYWHAKTHEDEVKRNLTEEIRLASQQGVLHLGGISMSGDGHIVIDHEYVLAHGLEERIEDARKKLDDPALGPKQAAYYQSVLLSLQAVLDFCSRYARLYAQLAQEEPDPKRKAEYRCMAHIASVMLRRKAQSFHEAVQSVYMLHVLQMIESNGHSFCYGRFDQYIEPYYENDRLEHGLSQEKALEILVHFFLMNSTCNKVRPYGHTKFSQGYPLYSNLVVGGLKPDGTDGTNDLSYLCIEAMNLCAMAEPNFSMRVSEKTPEKLLEAATRLIATGCGMPSLFNDRTAVQGLVDLGIPEEDALDYCPIGCVETGVPGKYGHRATGMTYVNWGKVIEIVCWHGRDPETNIQLLSLKETYETYEDVWDAWKTALKYYSDLAVQCDAICDTSLAVYDADPLASCLIKGSMEAGKTLKEGGCLYDVISQSNIGPSVVGNSLMSIKKLIYEEKKITWEQLLDAMKENWKTPEAKKIHKMILKVPKFGNDSDEVDQIVKEVFDSYLDLLPHYETLRKSKGPKVSCYTMSTSNITSYVPNGFDVGATPDGRYAGTPLNEGCSPTQGTDVNGPTAVINSVAKLPNEKVAAGQLLNMRFDPEALSGEDNLRRFMSFLKTSRKKGIYHNQFNVISQQTLLDAKAHPAEHQDLIVRVAGYCAQFISLMPEAQDAIIARTQNRL